MVSCSVLNCCSTQGNNPNKFSFHRFPTNLDIRNAWLRLIDRTNWIPKKYSYLCSKHFKETCFMTRKGKRSLIKCSIPTEFIPVKIKPRRTVTSYVYRDILKLAENSEPVGFAASATSTSIQPASQYVSTIHGSLSKAAVIFHKGNDNFSRRHNNTVDTKTILSDNGTSDQAEIKTEPVDLNLRQCSQCNETISGFVWACVQCGSHSCGACDARGLHHAHYVLRAPLHATDEELESVICQVRESLSSKAPISRDPPPCRVPDIEQDGVADAEKEFELVKMEIKEEEERIQVPLEYGGIPSTSTADQLPCYPMEGAENSGVSDLGHDDVSLALPETLTASDTSDIPPTNSEEDKSLAPSNKTKNIWTPDMKKYLVTLHKDISEFEKSKSRVYSRIQQAFAVKYPQAKVSKYLLEKQMRLCNNLLTKVDVEANVKEKSYPVYLRQYVNPPQRISNKLLTKDDVEAKIKEKSAPVYLCQYFNPPQRTSNKLLTKDDVETNIKEKSYPVYLRQNVNPPQRTSNKPLTKDDLEANIEEKSAPVFLRQYVNPPPMSNEVIVKGIVQEVFKVTSGDAKVSSELL